MAPPCDEGWRLGQGSDRGGRRWCGAPGRRWTGLATGGRCGPNLACGQVVAGLGGGGCQEEEECGERRCGRRDKVESKVNMGNQFETEWCG